MKRNFPILCAIIVAVAALSYFFSAVAPVNESFSVNYKDRTAVKAGRVLYSDNCASCHGARLEGESSDWRQRNPDGSLPAPPHDETGHTWHHSDVMNFNTVKLGGRSDPDNGFISRMPAYEDVLSDEEIHDILAYIKANWPNDIQQRHDAMNRKQK